VSADNSGRSARLLHPERLGREGDDGHHDVAVDDRLSDAGCRKHARHLRRPAACRSETPSPRVRVSRSVYVGNGRFISGR